MSFVTSQLALRSITKSLSPMALSPVALFSLAVLVCVSALIAPQALAQNMALKGAGVLDVTSGEILQDHTVIVEDGRIQAVGPARSTEIPRGMEVIDLQGHEGIISKVSRSQ